MLRHCSRLVAVAKRFLYTRVPSEVQSSCWFKADMTAGLGLRYVLATLIPMRRSIAAVRSEVDTTKFIWLKASSRRRSFMQTLVNFSFCCL